MSLRGTVNVWQSVGRAQNSITQKSHRKMPEFVTIVPKITKSILLTKLPNLSTSIVNTCLHTKKHQKHHLHHPGHPRVRHRTRRNRDETEQFTQTEPKPKPEKTNTISKLTPPHHISSTPRNPLQLTPPNPQATPPDPAPQEQAAPPAPEQHLPPHPQQWSQSPAPARPPWWWYPGPH